MRLVASSGARTEEPVREIPVGYGQMRKGYVAFLLRSRILSLSAMEPLSPRCHEVADVYQHHLASVWR